MKYLIEFVVAFLGVGLTYVITSEGLWGAALVFFNVLFAAMISFNFYESRWASACWTPDLASTGAFPIPSACWDCFASRSSSCG